MPVSMIRPVYPYLVTFRHCKTVDSELKSLPIIHRWRLNRTGEANSRSTSKRGRCGERRNQVNGGVVLIVHLLP